MSAQPSVDDKALDAVITAYYTNLINASTAARARAQSAYAIASATAAAIVAAGVLAGISEFPVTVQVIGALALVAWLATAALFMWVAREVPKYPTRTELEAHDATNWMSAEAFASYAVTAAHDMAKNVEDRLFNALVAGSIAIGLTAAAFVLALANPAENTAQSALTLSKDGAASLVTVCSGVGDSVVLHGTLDLSSLGADWLEVGNVVECPGIDVLRIASGSVQGVSVSDSSEVG